MKLKGIVYRCVEEIFQKFDLKRWKLALKLDTGPMDFCPAIRVWLRSIRG